jgi:drug/metabolite transporter (DMT)-like permease
MTTVCAIWGGAFVAIKIGLLDLPPLGSAAMRFGLTAVVLFVWARVNNVPLFYPERETRVLLLLALVFFYINLVVYVGTARTTSGRATVFFYSQPVFLAFLAHFFLPHEHLSLRKSGGLSLAFAGMVLLFLAKMGAGHAPTILGDALVLSGSVATAVQNLIMKRAAGRIHPVALILWSSMISSILLSGCSWTFERDAVFLLSTRAILSLLYLSLISAAFGFVVFAWLIQRYSATRVTALVFLAPMFGVVFGWLLLHETLSPIQLLGVAGVCAGVYIVTNSGERQRQISSGEETPMEAPLSLRQK